ncbi:hypothetical protein [Ruegeria profundi]|uniref:hypothetical protein n=1 Tax=Ruegeria profundi TaxID=1685378 RepID=UPI001CD5C10F|nr:hypothetical protein [Ruegeria profundi]MCA0930408.1 hypothetical protein [Ruegeria profundi]
MVEDFNMSDRQVFEYAASVELAPIGQLSADENINFEFLNLSVYEMLSPIRQNEDRGGPVYQSKQTGHVPFFAPAGVVKRLKAVRKLGISLEKPGTKKFQF